LRKKRIKVGVRRKRKRKRKMSSSCYLVAERGRLYSVAKVDMVGQHGLKKCLNNEGHGASFDGTDDGEASLSGCL
jgi:hypothetical protein